MRTFLSLLLLGMGMAAVFLLQLPSLSNQKPAIPLVSSLTAEQKITLSVPTEPPTLDPQRSCDLLSATMVSALFDGLTRVNLKGDVELSIAESIQHSPDYRTFIFRLRETSWSNGQLLKAEDFAYAWKKALDPRFNAECPKALFVIKNAEAVNSGRLPMGELGIYVPNERTLVVALEHSTPYLLELLSQAAFMPICESVDRTSPTWILNPETFVCNGPYCLKTWEHDVELILKKNTTYWDRKRVKLEQIRWLVVADAQAELNLFEKEQVDWVGSPFSTLSSEALSFWRTRPFFHERPIASTCGFLFNTEKPPFDQQKMRQAFSYAIDRQALVDHASMRQQVAATRLFPPCLSSGSRCYVESFNPLRARELFDQALSEQNLTHEDIGTVTLSYNEREINSQVAQAIQQGWQKIFGISVRLQSNEWSAHLSQLEQRQYQVTPYTLEATVSDPMGILDYFFSFGSQGRLSSWQSFAFQQAIDQAQATATPQERKSFLLESERILMEEMPLAPVYHYMMTYLKSPRLQDVAWSARGVPDFKWASMEALNHRPKTTTTGKNSS